MSANFPPALAADLSARGILAVLVIDRVEDAVPLVEALVAGGVTAIEIALRTEASLACVREIARRRLSVLVGAGTVLTPGRLAEARDAGASFALAPGANPRVLAAAAAASFPFAPGVVTPSDIETALEHGCDVLKFFPAEPVGGLAYWKTTTAPYAHLGLRYIPLGGIDAASAPAYLAAPSTLALGGSWIAPREAVRARDWPAIARRAAEAARLVRQRPART